MIVQWSEEMREENENNAPINLDTEAKKKKGGRVARGEEPSAEGYFQNLKQATQESAQRLIFERENTILKVRKYMREYATLYTV